MLLASLTQEEILWSQGHAIVVGVDEAGRGPLAGPVVAAAVTIEKFSMSNDQFPIIRDAKRLSLKQREGMYHMLRLCPGIEWGTGRVSEKIIDKINILEATKLAMQRAVNSVKRKLKKKYNATPGFLIIDGNFSINVRLSQQSIIKADETVFSCIAAGIIAKVKRDRMMQRYHRLYPEYGFDKHKGYGTKLHVAMLRKHGPCEIHRRSFNPVSSHI